MDALMLRDNARQQLEQIKTVETGFEYLSKVKAIETWAKAEKKDAELQNLIAEQKLRTQRILGGLIREGQERKEIASREAGMGNQHTALCNNVVHSTPKPRTLSQIGITRNESSTFQKIAALPEEVFEKEIASAKQESQKRVELTTSRVLKAAKDYEIEQKRKQREQQEKENIKNQIPSNIILLEGDVFDVIDQVPDNSIDILNTDPPYFILSDKWDTFKDLADFMDFTERWLLAVMPKVKKTGRVYISFAQWYQYDFYNLLKKHDFFGFNFKQNIIWYYKNNNQPSNKKEYRYMFEPIFYLYGKDAPVLNFTYDTYGETQGNVWEIATPQSNFNEGKYHSAQKPLELYKRIIKTGSFDGDTVLDCFAGSGTSGIVCKELDRKCILIEKEIDNINIIKGRL